MSRNILISIFLFIFLITGAGCVFSKETKVSDAVEKQRTESDDSTLEETTIPNIEELPLDNNPLQNALKSDSDSDGLEDILEIAFGTDPHNVDTDGDGYSDKEELDNGYDPRVEGDKKLTEEEIKNIEKLLVDMMVEEAAKKFEDNNLGLDSEEAERLRQQQEDAKYKTISTNNNDLSSAVQPVDTTLMAYEKLTQDQWDHYKSITDERCHDHISVYADDLPGDFSTRKLFYSNNKQACFVELYIRTGDNFVDYQIISTKSNLPIIRKYFRDIDSPEVYQEMNEQLEAFRAEYQ